MNAPVTTAKAAAIWGVKPNRFLQVMREYGVTPLSRQRTDKAGGLEYLWLPEVVLQVRAAHGEVRRAKNEAARVAREARVTSPRKRLAAHLLRRHDRLEKIRKVSECCSASRDPRYVQDRCLECREPAVFVADDDQDASGGARVSEGGAK